MNREGSQGQKHVELRVVADSDVNSHPGIVLRRPDALGHLVLGHRQRMLVRGYHFSWPCDIAVSIDVSGLDAVPQDTKRLTVSANHVSCLQIISEEQVSA